MWESKPEPITPDFSTEYLDGKKVAVVSINKPTKLNSLSWETFQQMHQIMEFLGQRGSEVRAIVLTGKGRAFSAGIDIQAAMKLQEMMEAEDPARDALNFLDLAPPVQTQLKSPESVRVPVIAAIHGYCLGAAVDVVSACDIRIATKDTKFSIKEIDVGFASDIGVIQRFQKVTGNSSKAKQFTLTGQNFNGIEAKKVGFLSKVVDTQDQCLKEAIQMARLIASKSPVAVTATKISLNFSRDHSVQQGLDHILQLNSALLQTQDLKTAAVAMMNKEAPVYPKL